MDNNDAAYKKLAEYIISIAGTRKRFSLTELGRMLNAEPRSYTKEELIDAFGTFPFEVLEQSYCEILDKIYLAEGELGQIAIDELSNPLDGELRLENFFPRKDKIVGSGTWIKVQTEYGYRVVLAKRASRYGQNFRDRKAKAERNFYNYLDKCKDLMEKAHSVDSLNEIQAKKQELYTDLMKWTIIELLERPPFYVVYNKTKTRKEYLLPHQYEIVEDIDMYVDYATNRSKGVSLKPIWTAQNKDMIFYLQSRGISRERAIALSMLNQCYIKVDIKTLVEEERAANAHIFAKD